MAGALSAMSLSRRCYCPHTGRSVRRWPCPPCEGSVHGVWHPRWARNRTRRWVVEPAPLHLGCKSPRYIAPSSACRWVWAPMVGVGRATRGSPAPVSLARGRVLVCVLRRSVTPASDSCSGSLRLCAYPLQWPESVGVVGLGSLACWGTRMDCCHRWVIGTPEVIRSVPVCAVIFAPVRRGE